MRKQRYIPFGYQLEFGKYLPHPAEAGQVMEIYKKYLAGHSYKQIAESQNRFGCPYSESSPIWNKNMVARILQDKRYLGDEQFPALITGNEYQHALRLQREKCTTRDIKSDGRIEAVKPRIFCAECGESFTRLLDNRVGAKWYCSNRCKYTAKITDRKIIDQITDLLNFTISDPDSITIPAAEPQTTSLEVTRLQNEINREMDKRDHDEGKIKALILQCAAEKYNLCDDGEQQRTGQRVKALFAASAPLTDLDTTIFENTVCKVLVDGNGIVTLELQNGQILKQNA